MNYIILTLRKLSKLLFNRIFYVAFAIILQLGWILMMVWKAAEYSQYISAGLTVLSLAVILWLVSRDMNPSYKLGWTLLITLFPIFGLVFFLLFGESRIATAMQKYYEKIQKFTEPYLTEDAEARKELEEKDISAANQSAYIYRNSGFPLCKNTTAEYFQVGDDMFPVLTSELEKAEHFIYIEYFIINDGVMWQTILEILERKASQGVDVRIIYDGFGCLTTLPYKYEESLREKGIQCQIFNPFRPILNIIQNNRDHRKICVIDGKTGFTGGINLADEYINQMERFGHWKDTAIMLKGEGVWNLTVMFLQMWCVVTGSKDQFKFNNYLPHKYHKEPFEDDGFVQPFSDTPLDHEVVGENVYLNIINKAKRYVYICTPYLIIDNEMMTALCLAAKSGVDVRIMTPGIPDKKIVFLLTQSYYAQLIRAGVKIYEYQPGFLHAKSFVCDDEVGVVGTINLDYRSLYLHFEDGVWLYKNKVIKDIYDDFMQTMGYCKLIDIDFCNKRSLFVRFLQSLLRLFAPLL